MPETDAVLWERFSRRADAEAFTELMHRYARLVYSTSWRVLRQETDAADLCRLRKGHAAENFSRSRRPALNLLKKDKTFKVGLKTKAKACSWDHQYLLNVLTQ